MKFSTFTVRIPRPSRRFSLSELLVVTALVAGGLAFYTQTSQYEVVALLQVVHPPDARLLSAKEKAALLARLRSDRTIRAALRKTGKMPSTAVDFIRGRIDARFYNAEVVSVTLRGRKLRDRRTAFVAILDEIVRQAASASTNQKTEVTVLQVPTIIE